MDQLDEKRDEFLSDPEEKTEIDIDQMFDVKQNEEGLQEVDVEEDDSYDELVDGENLISLIQMYEKNIALNILRLIHQESEKNSVDIQKIEKLTEIYAFFMDYNSPEEMNNFEEDE